MKWLTVIIKYRLWLGIVILGLAIFTHIQTSFWPSFILYLVAVVLIVGHFLFGPMRLIQAHMEEGDIESVPDVIEALLARDVALVREEDLLVFAEALRRVLKKILDKKNILDEENKRKIF